MKNLNILSSKIYLILSMVGILVLQSCTVYKPYGVAPLKVPEIVQMSKDKVPSKDIIKEIRKSRTVYMLKADQLAKLRNEGVQDSVINYMEKTHIDAVARNQRNQDAGYYYSPGWDGYMYGGLGWGWPYGGYGGYWGYSRGPGIIIENHRSFGREGREGGGDHDRGGHRH